MCHKILKAITLTLATNKYHDNSSSYLEHHLRKVVFGVRSCLSTQVWNKIERMMARDLILRLSGLKRFQQARQTAWLYVINQVFLMFRNAREGRTGPLYKENRQILDVNIFVSSFGFCGLSTYLSMIC